MLPFRAMIVVVIRQRLSFLTIAWGLVAFAGDGTPAGPNGVSVYAPPPEQFDSRYIAHANTLPFGLGVWAWALDDISSVSELAPFDGEPRRLEVVLTTGARWQVEVPSSMVAPLGDALRATLATPPATPAGEADPALVERARLGQYNERLHRAMASSLVGSREQPEVHAALMAVAERASDRQLAADLGFGG